MKVEKSVSTPPLKVCTKCKQERPDDQFYKLKTGYNSHCKDCRQADYRKRKAKDPSMLVKYRRKSVYGLTDEEFYRMLINQSNLCAICEDPLEKDKAHIDHDHEFGGVRGLLCRSCNIGIGNLKDSPKILKNAAQYLASKAQPLRAKDVIGEVPAKYKNVNSIKIKKDMLLLSGDAYFESLQGEGPTMGFPCIFVRLHHCNLRCDYCDAFYTWKKNSKEFWTEGKSVAFSQAAGDIRKTWGGPPTRERRIVWTGGEPLIQRNQIDEVMQLLWSKHDEPFWHPEIETNGTLMPTEVQLKNFQFNVSPKLTNNKADSAQRRIKPKILGALNEVNSTFKFVCNSLDDFKEIERDYLPHISPEKIIIMPEGVTEEQISYHAKILVRGCLKKGWRLMPRLQAIAFDGASRGV